MCGRAAGGVDLPVSRPFAFQVQIGLLRSYIWASRVAPVSRVQHSTGFSGAARFAIAADRGSVN
eukprot:5679077-Prymnesium_polylepis.1